MEKQLISIDWLEIHGHILDEELRDGIETKTRNGFTIVKEESGTQLFEFRYKVMYGTTKIATLTTHPRASYINKRCAIVKLENRVLYCTEWYDWAVDVLKACDIIYKNITRIDLCCDLRRFKDGRRPHAFIKKYVTSVYGEDGYLHRRGSNEFQVHGSKDRGGLAKMNYIAFGSHKAAVRAYIYNKSKELREVKDKPWIRQFWQENGLDDGGKTDIWRCEISIKAKGTELMNFETGELFKLKPDYVTTQKRLEQIFMTYAEKYLSFSEQHGQKRAKDFTPITLFEAQKEIPVRQKMISRKLDTGRTEKMMANKMKEWQETYRDLSLQELDAFSTAIAWLNYMATAKTEDYKHGVAEEIAAGRLRHMKSYRNICA